MSGFSPLSKHMLHTFLHAASTHTHPSRLFSSVWSFPLHLSCSSLTPCVKYNSTTQATCYRGSDFTFLFQPSDSSPLISAIYSSSLFSPSISHWPPIPILPKFLSNPNSPFSHLLLSFETLGQSLLILPLPFPFFAHDVLLPTVPYVYPLFSLLHYSITPNLILSI
jgi:hypothetical protein